MMHIAIGSRGRHTHLTDDASATIEPRLPQMGSKGPYSYFLDNRENTP